MYDKKNLALLYYNNNVSLSLSLELDGKNNKRDIMTYTQKKQLIIFPEAGLEPAAFWLEVRRATIAPHETHWSSSNNI